MNQNRLQYFPTVSYLAISYLVVFYEFRIWYFAQHSRKEFRGGQRADTSPPSKEKKFGEFSFDLRLIFHFFFPLSMSSIRQFQTE